MSSSVLKEALSNCLINFDRRVLLTDLLQEYELPYQEVHEAIVEHLAAQKGTKYEKRFLVHGSELSSSNEVFTVVQGEAKLQEWLGKLKNAEFSLYSVELAGGARTPAQVFKPIHRCSIELSSLKVSAVAAKINGAANGTAPPMRDVKAETKAEVKKTAGINVFTKKPHAAASTSEVATSSDKSKTPPETKKVARKIEAAASVDKLKKPEANKEANKSQVVEKSTKTPTGVKKSSPTEEKKKTGTPTNKKDIKNFFANAAKKEQKRDAKDSNILKPPTPKKMQDFFKKETEQSTASTKNDKKAANTSLQLFAEEEEVAAQVDSDSASSDEEENLAAIKRNIISSDHEDDVDGPSGSAGSKRRRILDSDDDEPIQKHDKKADEDAVIELAEDESGEGKVAESESFLDDEGFVTTIKTKKSSVVRKPTKRSSPTKATAKEPAVKSKAKPAPATKTKQGNIMNFFSKK